MSSTNKTSFLGLNSWSPTDVPKRADFNQDNNIIDSNFAEHFNNRVIHINSSERMVWNSPYYIGSYYGNSANEQVVKTGCPFKPSFGIVFAIGAAPSEIDFTNKVNYNYFGVVTPRGGTIGIKLEGTELTVSSSPLASISDEYPALNTVGNTYMYIFFR